MSAEEHLERIVAKCRELLATNLSERENMPQEEREFAALFSARAEAGWRATMEESEGLLEIFYGHQDGHFLKYAKARAPRLIAAWPEELL